MRQFDQSRSVFYELFFYIDDNALYYNQFVNLQPSNFFGLTHTKQKKTEKEFLFISSLTMHYVRFGLASLQINLN